MSGVDVVIPCYNYARFLPQCVSSVLEQNGVEVRVLIIDDCSSDDTEKVGLRLAEQDFRVEFRRHSENCGHIETYNEGLLGWASSPYCMLLSADDALAKGSLARAVGLMERHPDVGMTYGMAVIIGDQDNPLAFAEDDPADYRVVSRSDFLRHGFEISCGVPTPTAVVRTELQQRLGGYRADLPHSGDMEMWMRFAVHSDIGVVRAVQGFYRVHGNNMSRDYYPRLLSDWREVIQAGEQILGQWGDQFADSESWRRAMLHRLGKQALWKGSNAFEEGDEEAFRICVAFAEEICPELRYSGIWWRLRAKRILGKELCRMIRPGLNRLRSANNGDEIQADDAMPFPEKRLTGWWPE